jgi:hypothetical protein
MGALIRQLPVIPSSAFRVLRGHLSKARSIANNAKSFNLQIASVGLSFSTTSAGSTKSSGLCEELYQTLLSQTFWLPAPLHCLYWTAKLSTDLTLDATIMTRLT